MANEKNKINELVSDDDPTAELEALTFSQNRASRAASCESDEDTHVVGERRSNDAQTISKLRYDIEQLRAKSLGREAEIRAHEEITAALNAELAEFRDALERTEGLLRTRDRTIESLKGEIRERAESSDDDIDATEAKHVDLPSLDHKLPTESFESPGELDPASVDKQLIRTEEYADLLRRKLQDLMAQHDTVENERKRLDAALQRSAEREASLQTQVTALEQENANIQHRLAGLEDRHAEEIRMLRFEIGEAQDTVAQAEELNSQLASDLVDTRGFKEELERMLCNSDEQSRARIEELENKIVKVSLEAKSLEQKLEARSEAINVLLNELARHSEQIESIGEIGDVILDLDGSISEQLEEPDKPPRSQRPQDRVSRVFVGRIGDKLLRFPLFKDRLTIGRTADNDIQLYAPHISRRHAVVTTDGETTRIIDWGSKNGVHVNSNRVTEHFLSNGDILRIGNARFRYEERRKREA
jgi:chromosome segregation ATPase